MTHSDRPPLAADAPPDRAFRVPSGLACGVACLIWLALAWGVIERGRQYGMIFSDFKMKLPPLTQAVLGVPAGVVWGVCGLVAAGLVAWQTVTRSWRTAAVIHLMAVVVAALVWEVFREAMTEPLTNLITGMAGGGR